MNYLSNIIYLLYRGSIFFTVLIVLHYILILCNFRSTNTKYFLLHFLVNMYIIYLVWGDVVDTLWNPIEYKVVEIYPSFITILFHTYHILFYDDIPHDEKMHHLINVYITLPLLWMCYNKVCNFALSIMMGFPGGITYALLSLRNLDIISHITEKNISANLNLWIRCPGAICVAMIVYMQMRYHPDIYSGLTFIIGIISIIGTYWNGIYFMRTIVESRIRYIMLENMKITEHRQVSVQ